MKTSFLTVSLITFFTAGAQSVEDGKKQLYYERYASAESTFRQVLQQDPDNGEAVYGLTRALLLQEKPDQALYTLYIANPKIRDEAYYKVAYGAALLNQKKGDSASLFFSEALKQTKEKNTGILAAVAEAHIGSKGGNAAYATELIGKAIKREENSAALYTLLGDAWRRQGNASEAYKAYKEALAKDPSYAAASHRIGEIFLSQKNPSIYLEYFTKAIQGDPAYAPSIYQLYSYYFYHDAAKALSYYNDYAAHADKTLQTEYDRTDLYYLNKEYTKAIEQARTLIKSQGATVKPRMYKLLGYSYAALKDTATALQSMQTYFASEVDSNLIAKDFETMADYYFVVQPTSDSTAYFYAKAASMMEDSTARFNFYKKLASRAASQKNYSGQARWMGSFYDGNEKATNVDLFNWALAHYRAEEYPQADSVFGLYTAKYPEQSFGYYWRARANVAMDKEMKSGLAIPHYEKLIEVLKADTADANYKKWMTEAYGYLAAYEVNTDKDYAAAVSYFEKVLEIDPSNEDAKKYIEMLEKSTSKSSPK